MNTVRKFCMLTNSQGMSIIMKGTQEQIYSVIESKMKPEEYTNSNDLASQFTYEVHHTSFIALQGYKEPSTGLVTATMVLKLDDNFIIENLNDEENAQLTMQLSQEES